MQVPQPTGRRKLVYIDDGSDDDKRSDDGDGVNGNWAVDDGFCDDYDGDK